MSNIINGIAKDLKSIPEKLKAKTGNIDKTPLAILASKATSWKIPL